MKKPTTSLSPSEKSSSPSESTKPSPTPSTMPSVSDKPTSIEEKILEILLLANVSERDELEDDTSPQGKALNWIISEAGGLESGEENDIQFMPGGDDDQIILRYILAVLYHSTGGNDWIDKGQWLTSTSVCEWNGFSCRLGNKLTLSSNNLVGTIPSEIGSLPSLSECCTFER